MTGFELSLLAACVIALAWWGLARGSLTWSGAAAGVVLTLVYATSESRAPLVAWLTFATVGSLASRWGADRKRALGVLESDGRGRSAIHAIANGGVGAIVLVSASLLGAPLTESTALACGSISACFSDTLSSECGTWLGGPPRCVLTGRAVEPGTDGAVSFAGSLCGVAAAVGLAAVVVAVQPPSSHTAALFGSVAIAGVAGNLADSLLGATVEARWGQFGNAWVNASAAAVGAAVAWVALSLMT